MLQGKVLGAQDVKGNSAQQEPQYHTCTAEAYPGFCARSMNSILEWE